MPFHVEIKRGVGRAWAFNLSEVELRRTVIEPWRRGAPARLGDRDWPPRGSTLRILEGPELAPPDLAHGQGPNSARRSAEDVTRRVLAEQAAAAPAAIVVQVGDGPPPADARTLPVLRVDPEDPASMQALAERLRALGQR
jgi:hypothetical protein